jgi:ferric-dicitrate binding protein FerR (iron transport regulator)
MNMKSDESEMTARDEDALASLLRLAGPRSDVPEDVQARVYQSVRRAWEDSRPGDSEVRVYSSVRREWRRSARTRRRSWLVPLAMAASVVLAVGIALRPGPEAPAAMPAGTVVRAIGGTGGLGHIFRVGDRVETGAGEGLSIRLANAESLRIGADTTLDIVGRNRFVLQRGRVYADTGDRIYRDQGLVIETSLGEVTDVGTQFAVVAKPDSLEVAVREGRVDIAHQAQTIVTVAGERMALHSGEQPAIEKLATHDPYWEWTTALVPAYDIDNKSLLDFLRWVARETGRELVFEDEELRLTAMRTDLHGSVADVDPLEALQSIVATTTLAYHVEPGRIVIER